VPLPPLAWRPLVSGRDRGGEERENPLVAIVEPHRGKGTKKNEHLLEDYPTQDPEIQGVGKRRKIAEGK